MNYSDFLLDFYRPPTASEKTTAVDDLNYSAFLMNFANSVSSCSTKMPIRTRQKVKEQVEDFCSTEEQHEDTQPPQADTSDSKYFTAIFDSSPASMQYSSLQDASIKTKEEPGISRKKQAPTRFSPYFLQQKNTKKSKAIRL